MISNKRLLDTAYSCAHVCADLTEKMSLGKWSAKDVEKTEWLLAEARNLCCAANAIHNRATGNKPETLAP